MRPRIRRLIPAFAGLCLSGCVLPYYVQAIHGQARLLHQRVPIPEVIDDAAVDATTRDRLELVTRLRRFAVSELALPDNKSYTSYVDLERNFVVWNVVAAPEFSVDPLTWCFPVAGCVAYRGYFRRDAAEAFEAKLSAKGYDTFAGGSPAYSTLGHFADPVLNTMLSGDETEIAATLFHELAHQRVYVKNDTELSESFATAVEQYGVEAWLVHGDREDELAQYRRRLARQAAFAGLIAAERKRLEGLYAEDLEPSAMRRAKAEAYAAMQSEYETLKAGWGGSADYDGWFVGGFNNARLVAVTSYQHWVPGLRARLDALGPEAFYAAVETLTRLDPEVRTGILTDWNEASAVPAVADDR